MPVNIITDMGQDAHPISPCPHYRLDPLEVWIAVDGNGSVAIFESEPEWVAETSSWMCDMTGILEFSIPFIIQGMLPGQKRKVVLNFA